MSHQQRAKDGAREASAWSTDEAPSIRGRGDDDDAHAKDARRESHAPACVSATHTILFEDGEERCSVCGEHLEDEEEEDDLHVRGCGLLVWARGEERRYEEPQLCSSCAAAFGVTALQRWEIEEDEG